MLIIGCINDRGCFVIFNLNWCWNYSQICNSTYYYKFFISC